MTCVTGARRNLLPLGGGFWRARLFFAA